MGLIEARANLSFNGTMGFFMAGIRYQVDGDDLRVKALVAGGYLTLTSVKEDEDDHVGAAVSKPVSRRSVGLGVAGSKKDKETGAVVEQGDSQQS